MRDYKIRLDYAALRATPVATDPFPHIVVPHFVPPAALRAVLADLPPLNKRGSFPADAIRAGPGGPCAEEALEGPELRDAIAEKFEPGPGALADHADGPRLDRHSATAKSTCDSTAKRVTVLLYLNQESDAFGEHDGCLRLLRSPHDLEDYAVEVPPVNGTLLVFPNGPTSWHGHKTFEGQRYSMQLNYMTTGRKARSELRRHRLSAFVKRLTWAA